MHRGNCDNAPLPDVKSTGLIWARASQKELREIGRADNLTWMVDGLEGQAVT